MLTTILTTGRLLLVSWSVLNGNAIVPVPSSSNHPSLQINALSVASEPGATATFQSAPTTESAIELGNSADITAEEQSLIDQTNRDRESVGLPDLVLNPLLCIVARGHSQDMCQREYFGHLAPQPGPSSPMDRYLAALGYRPDYALVGENVYYRSATDLNDSSAQEADSAFMRSPSHRENILKPEFTDIGVGFYRDPNTGAFWVTEMFLSNKKN